MKIVGKEDGPADGKEFTWQENVLFMAQRMSQKFEEAFVFEMRAADRFLPHHHFDAENTPEKVKDHRRQQIEIFVDYTVGTVCALLAQYCSPEEHFEQHVIALVQDKFQRLRKLGAN